MNDDAFEAHDARKSMSAIRPFLRTLRRFAPVGRVNAPPAAERPLSDKVVAAMGHPHAKGHLRAFSDKAPTIWRVIHLIHRPLEENP